MARRIVFPQRNRVAVETFDTPTTLSDSEVRVTGICSMISTGTENIVLNGLYDPGTHWDAWVHFPFYPGYSCVGRVVECGHGVTHVRVGDRVAIHAGHASEHVVREDQCHRIPDDLSDDDAAWHSLAKIAYAGAKAAAYTLGERVLVVGGGPIGQLSARWALSAGAGKVVLTDPLASRMRFGVEAGIHGGVANTLVDGRAEIVAAFEGRCPDVVVDTTGAAAVFSQSLDICGRFGRVILLGDSGTPTQQHLTHSLLTKGIRVVGVHGSHVTAAEALDVLWPLVCDGRFSLSGLITHRFALDQAVEAYGVANARRAETMGILFELDRTLNTATQQ